MSGLMGQAQYYEVEQGQVLGPALGSQQPMVVIQAGETEVGNLPSGKGPGGAD